MLMEGFRSREFGQSSWTRVITIISRFRTPTVWQRQIRALQPAIVGRNVAIAAGQHIEWITNVSQQPWLLPSRRGLPGPRNYYNSLETQNSGSLQDRGLRRYSPTENTTLRQETPCLMVELRNRSHESDMRLIEEDDLHASWQRWHGCC